MNSDTFGNNNTFTHKAYQNEGTQDFANEVIKRQRTLRSRISRDPSSVNTEIVLAAATRQINCPIREH